MRHQWPNAMRSLVERFGEDGVYSAGLAVLGYPPTWIHTGAEALRVGRELAKAKGENAHE